MAQNSLSIQLQTNPSAVDTLREAWGAVLANYEKGTISGLYKNRQLSGDPENGVVNAKRFANATIKNYGTARSGRAGEKAKVAPVAVPIDDDKEFIEEVEEKDLVMYGVDGLINLRTASQESAMRRYYERKFFNVGSLAGTVHTITGSTIEDKLEEVIQKLEIVKNDFVDGVDRMDMVLVLRPSIYGQARNKIDTLPNAGISPAVGEFGMFHNVVVHSSVYLPDTVDYFIFVKESIAQPIRQSLYAPKKIELSDATAFGMFLYAGTKCVQGDLVFIAGTLGAVTAASTSGGSGQTTKTTITVTSAKSDAANDFYYLTGATAVAAPAWGDAVGTTWTKLVLTEGAQVITTGTATKIRIAEADAAGKIIKSTAELTITYGA